FYFYRHIHHTTLYSFPTRRSSDLRKVALADLDIVNMYFRTREKAKELEALGIKVIGSQINTPAIEVPSVSAEVYTPLQDESYDLDRKSTRLNSSHVSISYAVFCLK